MSKHLFFILTTATLLAAQSYGAEKEKTKAKQPAVSTEQRQKMAAAHEKMAACLRSEAPIGECMQEMRKSCRETMGKNGCPMGHAGMMGGKMRAHEMTEEDDKPE